jgi:hypothetical protein
LRPYGRREIAGCREHNDGDAADHKLFHGTLVRRRDRYGPIRPVLLDVCSIWQIK